MTTDRLRELVRSAVTEEASFEDALESLVEVGYRNGVDVVGGYEVQSRGDRPDLEVQITELRRPDR